MIEGNLAEVIIAQGFSWILIVLGILFLLVCLKNLFSRKSREYANILSDMFVVGTIRNLAKKDNIDLVQELHTFYKIRKRERLSEKGLVSVIEGELKEKVANVQEKGLDKDKE